MSRVKADLAETIFRAAMRVMPPARRSWGEAMSSELPAIPSKLERVKFALGCLSFAIGAWARTRKGLVWIGRILAALGLWVVAGQSAVAAMPFDNAVRLPLFGLSSVYLLGGLIACVSLRGLLALAIIGVCASGAGWMLFQPEGAVRAMTYRQAVAFEFGAMMAMLAVATGFLLLLRGDRDAGVAG